MDLTTALANTKVTWKVDGECHYVDLVPPADPADHRILETLPYRVTVKEYPPRNTDAYYLVFFGRHVLRGKIYDLCAKFYDLEVAKSEALKFAARMLIEALCNISPDIVEPFLGEKNLDFAFLGINPDEIEDNPLHPGWQSAPIDKDNFPRAKKAFELAGFEVDSGTNAEKQMYIWWKPQ